MSYRWYVRGAPAAPGLAASQQTSRAACRSSDTGVTIILEGCRPAFGVFAHEQSLSPRVWTASGPGSLAIPMQIRRGDP